MKQLIDLVEVAENNENCVLLKVKDNMKMQLINLGVFNGNEEFFRYTKGRNHTITVFKKDGSSYSWDFGEDGYTLATEKLNRQRRIIVKCIEKDLNIYCGEKVLEDEEEME